MPESVSFARPGGGTLTGALHMPVQRTPLGFAIIADRMETDSLAVALALTGIAAVRIDMADMEDTPPTALEAVLACARFLDSSYVPANLLIGHATGAQAVALAVTSLPDVRGVATIGLSLQDDEPFRGTEPPADVSFLALHHVSSADVTDGTVAAWASSLLAPAVADDAADIETGGGVTTQTGRSYRTTAAAGRHSLVVDEPASLGGSDTGPTPYDLIAAALGACTAITLRMYADRKGWPLEAITVDVRHSRVHAVDDANCDTDENARIDRLHRTISLSGDLDAEQHAKLLEIADKCPVHRTLDRGIVIETVLSA
ncbi:MAG TPA: OsmC family protein [Longimicrobiales bacterium]